MDPLLMLLKRLSDQQAEFVVIGGMAAILHGSSIVTYDVDVCAAMREPNFTKIIAAFHDIRPYFRMRPDKLRFYDDPARLDGFKNIYLRTDLGQIDLLGEIPEVCSYEDAMKLSLPMQLAPDLTCRVVDLKTLIAAKKVANRPKDRQAVRELEVILQKKRPPSDLPPPPTSV